MPKIRALYFGAEQRGRGGRCRHAAMGCGTDHVEFGSRDVSEPGNATAFVFYCIFLLACIAFSFAAGWPAPARLRAKVCPNTAAALAPAFVPLVMGAVFAGLAVHESNSREHVAHTGYVPPPDSEFYAPIMHFPELSPSELLPGVELGGNSMRYFCNNGGTWTWQGREYRLKCGVEGFENAEFEAGDIDYIEHRGNDGVVFPGRMGIKLKFDREQKLPMHNFRDKTYRFVGARNDPLRIRDAFMQKMWNSIDGNTRGIECTNAHVFGATVYLGVYSMCSDRDEGEHQFEPHVSAGEKAEYIVEIEPGSAEFERDPGDVCKDLVPKKRPYPLLPNCTQFHPYRDALVNNPEGVENYVNQFIFGELMVDWDAYEGSTFVHVTDSGTLRYGPQWDADLSFQFSFSGYKGWLYRTLGDKGRVHDAEGRRETLPWARHPSRRFEAIRQRVRALRQEGQPLHGGSIGAVLDGLARQVERDMHHDERAWSRTFISPAVYFADFSPFFRSTGIYSHYRWGAFEREFGLMKDLVVKRACWIEHSIEDLQNDQGPAVQPVVGVGLYFAWASMILGGVSAVYFVCFVGWQLKRCFGPSGSSAPLYTKLFEL